MDLRQRIRNLDLQPLKTYLHRHQTWQCGAYHAGFLSIKSHDNLKS